MTNGHGGQNGLENGHSGVIRPMQNGHGGHGVDGHGTLRGHHENNGTLKGSGGTILKKTSQGKKIKFKIINWARTITYILQAKLNKTDSWTTEHNCKLN